MKPIPKRILMTLGLLVMVGALVFTTSCGPEKHKIDDSTVLPFKDKAELDKLLDLSILPEYTIEEYYTKNDLITGDEKFVVCCKFLKEVSPADVQKIADQVDRDYHRGWFTFESFENDMKLIFDLDTTLTADRKRPDFLGNNIHVEIELPCGEKDSWKGFEVVFRNNRADFSVVVDRDTLSKLLGVDFPPLTETSRSDENIYFEFDTIPSEEFYQALEKAPHWKVSQVRGDYTFYDYDYDDGKVWITAELIKGETDFSFYRTKSIESTIGGGVIDKIKQRVSPRDKEPKE